MIHIIILYVLFLLSANCSTNGGLEEKAVEQQISSVEVEDETVKSKVDDNGRGEEASSDRHSEDTPHSLVRTRTESVEESVRQSPGFCFITRPDLYKFAKVSCKQLIYKASSPPPPSSVWLGHSEIHIISMLYKIT